MPRTKRSRITVKDLAKDLGMSVSTVSRAFYPDAVIAEATRKIVLERAHEIGYRPNPFAQSLITKKTQIVGMVVSDLTNPFYPEVMTRLTSLLQKQGMNVMLASAEQADGTRTFVQPQLQGSDNAVIIRRGDNLWRISRRMYGRGVRYTTIYLANEPQIVNPDLILPGQVFSVPKEPLPIGEAETIHRRLLEGMPIGPEYHLPAGDQ